MADNSFSKEEKIAFDDRLEKFNDALVMSALVNKYKLGAQSAERASDVIWRPRPYIAQSFAGIDQTANFGNNTQLSVPSQIGTIRSSHYHMDATELRDGSQDSMLADAATQKLASDVNVALLDTASNEGSVVIARDVAATGYDDIAQAQTELNRRGVQMGATGRVMALSGEDYTGMASNLAARETINQKPTRAYEESYIGTVAGFETHMLDYANTLTAAAGVTVTLNGANQYYTPVSTQASGNGFNQTNVDNRYQTVTIAVTSGTVKEGDCLTIAGVNSVHNITKRDTGKPMTFRIHSIVTGAGGSGTVQISPPMISNGGATDAEAQYKNVSATPADGAAITFLNTVDAPVNPFWFRNAIELLPSQLIIPPNSGMATMSGTTDQGIPMLMTRQGAIGTLNVQYRLDVFFGTVMLNPEMAGIELFNQT